MAAPYREGHFFLLPLDRGSYAVGLVARAPPRGGILLGYFFGPRRREAPGDVWLDGLTARHAAFACRFKDGPLYRGDWRLIREKPGFSRTDWPVPAFHRFDGSTTFVPGGDSVQDWRVEYAGDNLITPLREAPASAPDLQLADDIVYDPVLLADEVGRRVGDAVPTADETAWR